MSNNNSKQQVTDENITRCSSSGTKGKYSEPIHVDIVIEILSKLPTKSMAKCRCVSKLWSSIVRPPYYNQLFPIKSPSIRKLLFAFVREGKCHYFSSPQPQNPLYSSLVATRHYTINFSRICRPVHGLVCHQRTRENYTEAVVSNPVTGQYVTLPKLTNVIGAKSFLGYDPVNKQLKVLCISITMLVRGKEEYSKYRVLTFETGKKNLLWRKIPYSRPYHGMRDDTGICINGVLYFYSDVNQLQICCFDVRSESVDFISGRSSTLINYKGKLGAVEYIHDTAFELYVLEDPMKHQWSHHLYRMPFQFQGLDSVYFRPRRKDSVYSAGVVGRDEVVFYPKSVTEVPFYMCYYNLVTNIAVKVRVEVPAFESFKWHRLYMFPNYVEDVTIL